MWPEPRISDPDGANLESRIRTELHREIVRPHRVGVPSSVSAASSPGVAARPRRALLFAAALVVAAAVVAARQTASGQNVAASPGAVPQMQPASPAPAAPAQVPATTTLRVTSRETVVDVTVVDSKGQPVRNLKESDFTVKEDGKPQPIRSFQEVRDDTLPPPRPAPALPPNVYTNLQPPPSTSAVNILLLDSLNATLPEDQVAVKREAVKYLKSMPRGTRIAVLSLSTNIRVLQGFTSDPAVLVAAVDAKKSRTLPSVFVDTGSDSTLDAQIDDQMDLEADDVAAGLQQFENELDTEQQDIRNRMTLEALNQIAAYLAGIKGRKNLIWFTEGMPLNMFPTGGIDDLAEITDYGKDLRKTTDLLTAAEVAVYPVDARRLFSNPANGADTQLAKITKNTGAAVAARDQQFQIKKSQQELGMEAVAEATGGMAFYNTNDLKDAVAKAIANGANYYSLSYVPPDLNFDGRYHSIEIEVDRPNVHLAYRKGYNADDIQHNRITPLLPLTASAPEPYGNHMQASMGRGVPTSSELLFDVRVAPSTEPAKPGDPAVMGTLDPRLEGKPLVRYEFQYLLPSRQIAFREGPGGTRRCSLEFDIAAYDVFGKRITGLSQTISPAPVTAEQYQQFVRKPLQFLQQIDLPPGELFLRVGILDAESQKTGTLEIPLNVKKNSPPQTVPSGGKPGN